MSDDLRSLITRLAALEDAARVVPVVAPGDESAAVNPRLRELIDEERVVVAQIRRLERLRALASAGQDGALPRVGAGAATRAYGA